MTISRLTLVICIVTVGCIPYHQRGLKPLNPTPAGNPSQDVSSRTVFVTGPCVPSKIDSLQPEFRWSPLLEQDSSYDLAIYLGVIAPASERSTHNPIDCTILGKRIYYKEGLKGTSHKMEEPLKPNTHYIWAVRTRKGTKVGEWSHMEHSSPNNNFRYYYSFVTPDKL